MKVCAINNITFQRRLNTAEEAEYSDVLKLAKEKAGNTGKSILIVPSSSLPNETGAGNLGTSDSLKFFDFAKQYWGINEIQILPSGQYHEHNKEYPIYSGTSMDLGNHMINIKNYALNAHYQIIKDGAGKKNYVNFANIVDLYSPQEKAIKELHYKKAFNKEFEDFKRKNTARLEQKALYRALGEIHHSNDYRKWCEPDRSLYDTDAVDASKRSGRIREIYKQMGDEIDFYYFKQFLAEDSLKKAKNELNKKGLKLDGDMLCGFSLDEVWANPKAFHKGTTIGWGLPALNYDSPEGEKLLREKVKFYAERFDGLRIDASWTYANQPLKKAGGRNERKYYSDKILNIIDDEIRKVKGNQYDFKNIMHEFSASSDDFDIYDNSRLKPFVENRMKIYTSEHLSDDWGSNRSFLNRGWNPDSFIIGASNHDSRQIEVSEQQAKVLGKILKIPYKKLLSRKEFVKAKLAEPMSAKNNMIYFMDALNLDGQFQYNAERHLNYAALIPNDYEKHYFDSLEHGKGFNPMDALEKTFKSKGLDKKEPELYKKIVKYRKILEGKDKKTSLPIWLTGSIICIGLVLWSLIKYRREKDTV